MHAGLRGSYRAAGLHVEELEGGTLSILNKILRNNQSIQLEGGKISSWKGGRYPEFHLIFTIILPEICQSVELEHLKQDDNHNSALRMETLIELKFISSSFSSSNFSIRAFRAHPVVEIRQTVPCRAIRGNGISVN